MLPHPKVLVDPEEDRCWSERWHQIQHTSLFLMCLCKITIWKKVHMENKDKATRATSHRNALLTMELQRQDRTVISFTSILSIIFVV